MCAQQTCIRLNKVRTAFFFSALPSSAAIWYLRTRRQVKVSECENISQSYHHHKLSRKQKQLLHTQEINMKYSYMISCVTVNLDGKSSAHTGSHRGDTGSDKWVQCFVHICFQRQSKLYCLTKSQVLTQENCVFYVHTLYICFVVTFICCRICIQSPDVLLF